MYRPSSRYVLPEFTERTTHGSRTLDPYSKLFEDRIIFLGTAVDETSANDVIAQFVHLEYDAPDRDIRVYINSPGGSVDAMSAIYDTMQLVTCDVETVCLGQAAATAAVLVAAGTPGKRMALPGARFVLNQPRAGEPVRGQPSDLAIHAQEMLRQRSLLITMLTRHTGRSEDRIAETIERDTILDAPGAVSFGLIDHVTESRKTSARRLGPVGG
ncbi:ATP-dependent Clp protease proteolytic subunit [Streptomyces corynorhini]|uniref:ATP-dependent Clp protease proteolytic subunit n=1 Tax=Streptomyces corynorhini TaxID=2282652 RepID=A0A370B405_9ACTN|nr:ATP-dependent Clp protease proteolytic subunit [Streptomyces corynorhini]RDG34804.1 ATP-dependent Clp protease proteolytic subunit [Streptomyces corynorhini]